MHAVDRLVRAHVPVQRLQHQAVAAERHHDVGVCGIVIAVQLRQLRQRRLRLRAWARDEGDPVISLGAGHGISGSSRRAGGSGRAQGRLYDLGRTCRDDLEQLRSATLTRRIPLRRRSPPSSPKKKPRQNRGFLPSPLERRSVLGDQRCRAAEPIVHADLDLADVGPVGDDGRAVGRQSGLPAEGEVIVFSLRRPVLAEVEFGAVAERPADACARARAEAGAARKRGASLVCSIRRIRPVRVLILTGGGNPAVLKRGAALAVDEGAAQSIADAARRGSPDQPVLSCRP